MADDVCPACGESWTWHNREGHEQATCADNWHYQHEPPVNPFSRGGRP